ncbi:hypothetical protein VTP01DRAFT_2649 [Rhizomucor pusillus]|uniref:uncharacterized protein n=1 Tax=Rhizomucor pusillus TaxID=4840 RepID=UPI0037435FEE
MLLQQALSLVAIGIVAISNTQFVKAEPLTTSNALAVVHGVKGKPIQLSANYLAGFDADDAPEPKFELVDTPEADIGSKIVSLRKRGSGCAEYYTVEKGDSCHAIAKEYGLSTSEFMGLNPQINSGCSNLHIHKKYCVKEGSSSSGSSSSSSGCSKQRKITSSDTCQKLAKEYGLSLDEFYDLNPSINRGSCDNLIDGKKVCVSGGSSSDDDDEDSNVSVKITALSASAKKSKKSSSKKSSSKKSSSSSSGTEKRKKLQSSAAFTYYWIAQADDYTGGKKVPIKTCSGKTIAKVNANYADALVMEGTGIVGNDIVNLGGCSCNNYKCFETIDRSDEPYGITAYGSALRPYVTVAANDFDKGTKIYVPQLVGWKIPGSNKKHNGCLLVDDQSWSFSSHHIDFYVFEMSNYEKLDKANPITKVDIYEGGNCKLLNYL